MELLAKSAAAIQGTCVPTQKAFAQLRMQALMPRPVVMVNLLKVYIDVHLSL
jgi:hypothetical protein